MKRLNYLIAILIIIALQVLVLNASGLAQCASDDPSSPVGITPTEVAGNPDLCEGGKRFDPPVSGTFDLDAYGNQVTITISSSSCGQVFSWSVSGDIVIDQVVAKGGNSGANVYDYTGELTSPTSDGNLHAPLNPSGSYSDLSHIDFCFHYKLTIGKTATPKFTRTYDWSINKSCDGLSSLTLSTGQIYDYPFSWTASISGYTDSDIKVEGTITIENNTPFDFTIISVTDEITPGPTAAVVDCGINYPYVLTSGSTLNCTYSAFTNEFGSFTNLATVTTSAPFAEDAVATVDFTFGDPTTEVDGCITVSDDCNSPTEVCVDDLDENDEYTLNYTCPVGAYNDCGGYTYTNTASFTTNDQGLTGSNSCDVLVDVPCDEGCTLTPGYWKTHSQKGPAPYDDNWANLDPLEENTIFFLSGQTYYEVLWTAPQGNAYYILAHAYIAAELNQLNGASIPTDVMDAFDFATDLFIEYTPDEIGALHGNRPPRGDFLSYAETLDDYNNGITGPGHCSEEPEPISEPKLGENNIPESEMMVPDNYVLTQNYPNPFNPVTTISFGLPVTAHVTLTIYDVLGKEIMTLVNEVRNEGTYVVRFDASDIPSGIYFYRMRADTRDGSGFIQTNKMILMK